MQIGGTILFFLFSLGSFVAEGEPVFDLTLKERADLERQEPGLRNAVSNAAKEFGEDSKEKATALHQLGRVLYKLEKYSGLRSAAKEIARIEELLKGPNSKQYALALRNVGSVSYRLGLKDESAKNMLRSLNILLQYHDEQSKEILYHKSIMLTFGQQKDYEDHPYGLSHEIFTQDERDSLISFGADEF